MIAKKIVGYILFIDCFLLSTCANYVVDNGQEQFFKRFLLVIEN